jgi:hypothetical protein
MGAQIILIGAPEPMSIEAVLAARTGGYLRIGTDRDESLSVADHQG